MRTHCLCRHRERTGLLPGSRLEPRSVSEAHSHPSPCIYLTAYDSVLYDRFQEGQYDTGGVGLQEAKHWYQQVYGRSRDIRTCSPRSIGHAAAYSAYRIWVHNPSISGSGSGYGQRREAFIAIAEGQRRHPTS